MGLQQRLKEAEAHYRDLIESCPEIVLHVDDKRRILHANRAGLRKLGYGLDEMTGMPVEDLAPKGERQRVIECFDEARRAASSISKSAFLSKTGQRRDVEINASAITRSAPIPVAARTALTESSCFPSMTIFAPIFLAMSRRS